MYLSRMEIDLRNPSARQALRDCNDMHRNLMAGFALKDEQPEERKEKQILYRKMTDKNGIYLLVSSTDKPDTVALSKKGFILNDSAVKDTAAVCDALAAGRNLRFDILVSPCKKVQNGGNNSRRVFLKTQSERIEWMNRKAEQNGFSLLTLEEYGANESIDGNRGNMKIHYTGIRYTGVLQIVDAELFRSAYRNGIGAGKAYGLGMLLLAKP